MLLCTGLVDHCCLLSCVYAYLAITQTLLTTRGLHVLSRWSSRCSCSCLLLLRCRWTEPKMTASRAGSPCTSGGACQKSPTTWAGPRTHAPLPCMALLHVYSYASCTSCEVTTSCSFIRCEFNGCSDGNNGEQHLPFWFLDCLFPGGMERLPFNCLPVFLF